MLSMKFIAVIPTGKCLVWTGLKLNMEEVQSWRISHAGTWADQTLPPLALGFNLRRTVDGQERVVFLRLRLVLVKASRIPSAQSHVPALKRIVHDAFDTRHRLTLPEQRTSELMLWGYAIDKQHRVMAWLGPAYSTADPFAPKVRHWKPGTLMHTAPLPGTHFFDAWRIRPSLLRDPKMGEKLLSLGKDELIPQEAPNTDYGQADRADIQHRREQEREARGAAKSTAQRALETSHVHRLAALVTEKADLLKKLAILRKSHQHEVKEASKGKAATRAAAPKKQKTAEAPSSAHCSWQSGDGSRCTRPHIPALRGTISLSIHTCSSIWWSYVLFRTASSPLCTRPICGTRPTIEDQAAATALFFFPEAALRSMRPGQS